MGESAMAITLQRETFFCKFYCKKIDFKCMIIFREMIPLKVTHVETDKTYIAFNCISKGI